MNCATCKEHIVDYLYEELDDPQRRAFEGALERCPECAAELAALKQLLAATDQAPALELTAEQRALVLSAAKEAAAAMRAPKVVPLFRRPGFQTAIAAVFAIGIASWVFLRSDRVLDQATQFPPPANQEMQVAQDLPSEAAEPEVSHPAPASAPEPVEVLREASDVAFGDALATETDAAEAKAEEAPLAVARARRTPSEAPAEGAAPSELAGSAAAPTDRSASQPQTTSSDSEEAAPPAVARMHSTAEAPRTSFADSDTPSAASAGAPAAPEDAVRGGGGLNAEHVMAQRSAPSARSAAPPRYEAVPQAPEAEEIAESEDREASAPHGLAWPEPQSDDSQPKADEELVEELPEATPQEALADANQVWEANDFDEAYERFLDVDRKHRAILYQEADSLYHAADSARHLNKRDQQVRWARRYLEIAPEGRYAAKLKTWLPPEDIEEAPDSAPEENEAPESP